MAYNTRGLWGKLLSFVPGAAGIVGWLVGMTQTSKDATSWLVSHIAAIPAVGADFPNFAAVTINTLNKINTYFPLQESFAIFPSIIMCLLAITVIRIVKSFVPTIA